MQLSKYLLVSILISFTALLSLDRLKRSATAHPDRNFQVNKDIRVGYNQQLSYSLGAANRAQQAYYLEQAKFAKNRQELSESGFDLPDSSNYELVIESQDSAFIYGIPQQDYGTYKEWSGSGWLDAKEPLYSYVSGIAYIAENGTFQSIQCVSKTIGQQKLAEPEIVDGKFICAEDSEILALRS